MQDASEPYNKSGDSEADPGQDRADSLLRVRRVRRRGSMQDRDDPVRAAGERTVRLTAKLDEE